MMEGNKFVVHDLSTDEIKLYGKFEVFEDRFLASNDYWYRFGRYASCISAKEQEQKELWDELEWQREQEKISSETIKEMLADQSFGFDDPKNLGTSDDVKYLEWRKTGRY